jgi:hypothetical protein
MPSVFVPHRGHAAKGGFTMAAVLKVTMGALANTSQGMTTARIIPRNDAKP